MQLELIVCLEKNVAIVGASYVQYYYNIPVLIASDMKKIG